MSEYAMPWAPTPLHARLPAVRAYVEGESLCDEGQTTDGLAKLKEAIATAWELDLPEWPGWAECLYHQVTHGLVPSGAPPPPQLAADTSSSQPAVAALACDGGGWWASEAAVAAIAGALRSRNHVLVDGFLGRDGGLALRGAIEAAWEEGALQPAKVAQPGNGLNGQRSDRTRSDHIAWVDFAAAGTARWGALGTLVTQADSLVQALLRAAPEVCHSRACGQWCRATAWVPPLRATPTTTAAAARARTAMGGGSRRSITATKTGAPTTAGACACTGRRVRQRTTRSRPARRSARCCSNHSRDLEERSAAFLTPASSFAQGADGAEAAAAAAAAGDAHADVAPLLDRLLLFFSDFRVPHEVLAARRPRFACTLWYMERDEGSVSLGSAHT
jgi:hypothetical protein